MLKKLVPLFAAAVLLLPCSALASGQGMLHVLGMGPGGPDLTAPRALETLEKADIVLGHPDTYEKFRKHIPEEKYAFNPWEGIHGGNATKLRKQDREKWLERVKERRKELRDFAMERIEQGQDIAIMDSGDPCVYGPALYWLLQDFPREHLEVIPGMSAFNAASAALEQPMVGEAGFVVLTSPRTLLQENGELDSRFFRDMAQYEPTLVLYMALKTMDQLVRRMKEEGYPGDHPAAVVYFAGYPDKEEVVRGTLGNIVQKVESRKEDMLGLVIIGEAVS
jgi:precorrin-4 methylase